ncbi:MAG: DUF4956 domain-containing protein [Sedimentisphaerales bacterium]|nr:DUF4956 domain-containing protein [Sedimentisphaerales bacterium]
MLDELWRTIDGASAEGLFPPESIVLSLLLAFVLGQLIAWVYYVTHSGLSYSKSFTQSLILITVVVAMVMGVIGSSIITAFGLMGALAIIRFRNILKDTRDVSFIFCSLVIGMATGSQRYAIAIVGTMILCLIAIYLHLTGFGTHQPHNGFLRFRLIDPMDPNHPVLNTLKKFCSSFTLISLQDIGIDGPAEYAYHLMIRNAAKNEQMLTELEKIEGLEGISLTMQEQLLEV